MKKITTVFLALALLLSAFLLPSCQEKANESGQETNTATENLPVNDTQINLMALQGPTGMGLAKLLSNNKNGTSRCRYNASIVSSAEITNIVAAVANGSCDIAAVPVNLAATLYAKTKGDIQVLCGDTLGVLYMLENGDSIKSVADLKGKTIYATGQSATPEYILRYVLFQNGIDPDTDVTIQFVGDHSELATYMANDLYAVGMLPEPNVSVVTGTNEKIRVALDMTEEWNELNADGSALVQGVFVARKEFVSNHRAEVLAFLDDYKESVEFVNAHPLEASALIVEAGIISNQRIAEKAIPGCHIVCLEGDEMVKGISATLAVLFKAAPSSVGGAVPPAESFYLTKS